MRRSCTRSAGRRLGRLCLIPLLAFVWSGAARAQAPFTESVRDAFSGEPLAGAIVRLQSSDSKTFTDGEGRFSLVVSPHEREGRAVLRIVAGAQGFFYLGLDAGPPEEPLNFWLEAVPHDPHASPPFSDPVDCIACHREQVEEWQGSAMAHSGRNAWVEDLYSGTGTPGGQGGFVYLRDSIFARDNPASECAACHQPEAWAEAPHVPLRLISDTHPSVTRGVSCLTCHLMSSIDESKPNHPGIYPGVVRINRGSTVRFGTLGDVDHHAPGRMRASYQPQLSSAACAACHQDSADPSGQGHFDGVISEPTYLEWKASPYAAPESALFSSCMDCHSEPRRAERGSNVVSGSPRPLGQLRTHRFEGTTPAFLENAVRVELNTRLAGDRLHVEIALTNHATGHHVPTGVTMRNMILIVEAQGPDGALEHLGEERIDALGGVGDPSQGYYAGLPGKLYAKVNQDAEGQGPTLFTEAASLRSDTRLAALETDRTTYAFRAPASGELKVRARVIYRQAWRAFVDAKGWTEDGHGRPLADLAPPHFGHLMASAEETLRPDQGCGCDPGGALLAWLLPLSLLRAPRPRRAMAEPSARSTP